jgi:hypothetical protein
LIGRNFICKPDNGVALETMAETFEESSQMSQVLFAWKNENYFSKIQASTSLCCYTIWLILQENKIIDILF